MEGGGEGEREGSESQLTQQIGCFGGAVQSNVVVCMCAASLITAVRCRLQKQSWKHQT